MGNKTINKEELEEWLTHPVTQEVKRTLKVWQQVLMEQWASGAFTDMSQFGTAILNAKAIGQFEALARVLDISLDQLGEELDD
jgi:hypothetical protein